MSRRAAAAALVVSVATTTALLSGTSALAVQPAQTSVVSAVPQAGTPQISDGAVFAVAQVGATMVTGGSFTKTAAADGSSLSTPYVIAFDATSGALQTSFAPRFDGMVNTVLAGPVAGTVWVGGLFKTMAGVAVPPLVLLNVADGSLNTSFTMPRTDYSNVQTVKRLGNRLFVGGGFTKVGGVAHGGIVTLNATTGALDPFMASAVTVNHSWTTSSPSTAAKAAVAVNRMDISPDGSKLVAIGNFKYVDGLLRDQLVMWDLTGTTAAVSSWSTSKYQAICNANSYDSYVRDVDFSPDGTFFAVGSTGGYGPAGSLCDSAARFETTATGSDTPSTWIDYTGKDTILSVAVTASAVYVGGHQRWLNNSLGADNAGPGAVPRPGVGALDPVTGLPLSWNPGRAPRGAGTYVLFATPTGLWMGSDTNYVGNYKYKRSKIAFFPLQGGAAPAAKTVPSLPASVLVGTTPAAAATGVLYRVNAGGPLVQSTDAGPDWAADSTSASIYRNSGSTATAYPSPVFSVDSTVPAGAPSALFADERYDPGAKGDGKELQWRFPVAAGTKVDVRVYYAARAASTSTTGSRTFDVVIDGVTRASAFDIVASAGFNTGTMRAYPVTSDGYVDLGFVHGANNPVVSAIEIVPSGAVDHPLATGTLSSRTFTGTTAGAASTVSSPLDPSTVRGAVVVGGNVFYGKTDGGFYSRTLKGGAWGPETVVDPYDDPTWSTVDTGSGNLYRGLRPNFYNRIPDLTSLAYDGSGRLYYTLYKQSGLFTRTFSPDSGIVGTDETQLSGITMPDVTGAFLSGSTLYYATRADGNLSAVGFNGTAFTGSATVVSGPGRDGVDWRGSALFLAPQNAAPVASATVSCTDLHCSADGTGSSDPDGTVTSWLWSWGDGSSSTGATATHDYAAAGSDTVTLTVTDDGGASATTTRTVSVTAHVDVPPTASFTSSCDLASCSFDGRGSSDSDGTVTGWSWTFGDGGTATGATPRHVYAGAGPQSVTLTVTDDAGVSASTTQQLVVQGRPASSIAFRSSSSLTSASASLLKVPVPAGVVTGDALLLSVTTSGTGSNPTPPSGWTELSRQVFGTGMTVVWERTATSVEAAGGTVQVQLAGAIKSTSQLLAYSGVSTTSPVSAVAATADSPATSNHTAPAVSVAQDGSRVVWFWSDKSSLTTAWTLPPGLSAVASGYGSGTGYVTAVSADEGAARPAGTVPAQVASTDGQSRAGMVAVVLAPLS